MEEKEQVSKEHEIRVEKVSDMEAAGLKPWPSFKPVTATCQQAVESFVEGQEEQEKFALAGRLISRREHGKTIFCNIQDRSGSIQVYIKKDNIGDESFENFKKFFDVGDIVWINGPVFKTRLGEITIKANEISLLSKCLHPLPEKFHGLVDIEQRYRQRYLDLISNPESRARFQKRSKIVQSIRNYLLEQDFLEVETPMLHPIPGGATARPFITHHNAYDIDLYLRIAPELYLKRLVVGGFERVFEINRNFRNEGVSTKHNPEFTMIEWYMAHGDYKDGIDLTEGVINHAVQGALGGVDVTFGDKEISFKAPFKRLSIEESLVEIGGFDKSKLGKDSIDDLFREHKLEIRVDASYGEKLFFLFETFVEDKIVQPTFIIGYPIEVSPLAKRDPNNPDIAARFELFVAGMELANGFTELNDPFDQAERFKQQAAIKDSGDDEAHHYDADYVRALEYALPPTVGVGLGIDRLVMLLTNTTSIKDVILFPTMKSVDE
ncbi:lysine--tRNA ligase [Candidatus Dependentiae bacterium]|nr:lysine--tRNA ligase [Candidatus Dependentiae bacterium]